MLLLHSSTCVSIESNKEAINGTGCTDQDIIDFLTGNDDDDDDDGYDRLVTDDDDDDFDPFDYNSVDRVNYGTDLNHQEGNDKESPMTSIKSKKNKKRHGSIRFRSRSRHRNRFWKKKKNGKFPMNRMKSHKGHRKIKPIGVCDPEKEGTCQAQSFFYLPISKFLCDSNNDYCADDCDCPGYQKCCVNSCGRKECMMPISSVTKESETTSNVPESVSEKTEEKETTSNFPTVFYRAFI